MADKISVDELKVFIGTKLIFQCPDEDNMLWHDRIDHMYDCGDIDTLDGISFRIEDIGTEECKPMVRPLSDLSQEMKNELDICNGRVLNPTDLYIFHAAKDKSLSYKDMLYLSNMHYDVFNWLNRTGEDGTPLAVELTK